MLYVIFVVVYWYMLVYVGVCWCLVMCVVCIACVVCSA